MDEKIQQIKNIKRANEKKWLGIHNVTGVGIGMTTGQKMGIIVSVSGKSNKIRSLIPAEIEGVPVEIKPAGPFFAQDE
ncbi:MAG: hypothetical protein P8X42_09655 [Calditrichaceae bacterium]|jgi:hypothetical protein